MFACFEAKPFLSVDPTYVVLTNVNVLNISRLACCSCWLYMPRSCYLRSILLITSSLSSYWPVLGIVLSLVCLILFSWSANRVFDFFSSV